MTISATTNPKAGFTLIEALLAVAIFAIVLAAINTVFFAVLRLRNTTMDSIEAALPMHQALAILQRDLEGIMVPGEGFAKMMTTSSDTNQTMVNFTGERVTPDIYTTTGPVHELAQWADAQKVAYFLELPTNSVSADSGRDLVRIVTHNLLPVNYEEAQSQPLLSGVETVRMQYYDGLTWIDTWDETVSTNLPAAIKVQILLTQTARRRGRSPLPIELIVPVAVRATNSVEL